MVLKKYKYKKHVLMSFHIKALVLAVFEDSQWNLCFVKVTNVWVIAVKSCWKLQITGTGLLLIPHDGRIWGTWCECVHECVRMVAR